jgi:hypothetical protein
MASITIRAVVALFERGVGEGRQEKFLDQLVSQPSTTAVRQDNPVVSDLG